VITHSCDPLFDKLARRSKHLQTAIVVVHQFPFRKVRRGQRNPDERDQRRHIAGNSTYNTATHSEALRRAITSDTCALLAVLGLRAHAHFNAAKSGPDPICASSANVIAR